MKHLPLIVLLCILTVCAVYLGMEIQGKRNTDLCIPIEEYDYMDLLVCLK